MRKINRIQLSNQSTDTVGTFKLPEISVSAVEVTKAINGLLFNSPTQSRTRVLSPSLINLDTKGSATDGSSLLSGSIFSINRRNDSLISLKDLQQRDPLGLDLLQPFLNLYLQGAEEKLQESVKQRLTDLFNRKLFNRIQIAKGSATQRDVEFLTDWHETLQKSSYLRHYWRSRYKRELKLTGNQIELLTAFNSSRSFEEAVRTGLIYQEPIILDPVQASEPDILTLVIESPVILSPYLLGPYVLGKISGIKL